jgi:hypothetical protein
MGHTHRASGHPGLPRGGSLLISFLLGFVALGGAGAARALAAPPAAGPHVYGQLSDGSVRNVRLGYVLALEMVRPGSPCSALFAPFHAVAVERLSSTFFAAPTERERTCLCVGGVGAFTAVGSRVTKLCPEFGALHPRVAALTLVHEALHSAGMPEAPGTPGALTSRQINALVAGACGSPQATRRGEHAAPLR